MLAGAFEGCHVTTAHGITVVRSEVPDQAALQGLINRVHALGLELLDVHLVAVARRRRRVGRAAPTDDTTTD